MPAYVRRRHHDGRRFLLEMHLYPDRKAIVLENPAGLLQISPFDEPLVSPDPTCREVICGGRGVHRLSAALVEQTERGLGEHRHLVAGGDVVVENERAMESVYMTCQVRPPARNGCEVKVGREQPGCWAFKLLE